MNIIPIHAPISVSLEAERQTLTRALCSWFVRRDGKYYSVSNPNVPLSRPDVKQIAFARFEEEFPDITLTIPLLKAVFARAIEQTHTQADETIAVWGGRRACLAGNPARIVRKQGVAVINTWTQPHYRQLGVIEADYGLASDFLAWIFPREAERNMVLNWLAWCLQNESDKPTWAPFLYSRSKGSGKSTFCALAACLFGEGNAVTQNNVDALTSRFNMTTLHSKLVISEELQLKQDGPQANALKTYITEATTLAEMKGHEAERVTQQCCFIFTTNHLPLWIEAEDRRYYIVDIDHDGHATGDRSEEFSDLVARLMDFLADPVSLAKLYNALMARPLPESFSAKTLNVASDATEIMKRIHQSSRQVSVEQLEEQLNQLGRNVIPEAEVAQFVQQHLRGNINSIRHMMGELGWTKQSLKWGGKDYARAIWVRPGFSVDRGKVHGPNGWSMAIDQHLGPDVDMQL